MARIGIGRLSKLLLLLSLLNTLAKDRTKYADTMRAVEKKLFRTTIVSDIITNCPGASGQMFVGSVFFIILCAQVNQFFLPSTHQGSSYADVLESVYKRHFSRKNGGTVAG